MRPEIELIKDCQRYDRKAQEELYNRYSRKLQGVVLLYLKSKDEAKDILHEAFIKILVNITSFKFEGSFEGWMRRIVVTTALSYLREVKKLNFNTLDEDFHEITTEEEPEYLNLSMEALFEVIYTIPEKYRLVFILNIIEGYSHKEIAEKLLITEVMSRTRLKRARQMLRTKIQ